MSEKRFDYNDAVGVVHGPFSGRDGVVVGLPSDSHLLYTVEFEDGSDAQLKEDEVVSKDQL